MTKNRLLAIAALTAAALALSGCGKIARSLDTPDGEDHPFNPYPNPKLDPQPGAQVALPSSADQPGETPPAKAAIQPAQPYGILPDTPYETHSGPMMGGGSSTTPQ
ncbi:MAG: hypothetical protein PW843_18910 [Azospirillaceae bacterium]|nr:hypothetical protein [Azospirillaceae bacterium]